MKEKFVSLVLCRLGYRCTCYVFEQAQLNKEFHLEELQETAQNVNFCIIATIVEFIIHMLYVIRLR